MVALKKKIQEQNYSWDQALAWKNGEEEEHFKEPKERAKIEKQLEELTEEFREYREKTEGFQLALAKQMDLMMKENRELKQYLKSSEEKREQLAIENLRKSTELKKQKGWFTKLIGK